MTTKLTRQQLIALNKAAGGPSIHKTPGEVLTDVDGVPTAVAPTEVKRTITYGVIVSKYEVQNAGLTPSELPNLTII